MLHTLTRRWGANADKKIPVRKGRLVRAFARAALFYVVSLVGKCLLAATVYR
jgi:hypothetical protein